VKDTGIKTMLIAGFSFIARMYYDKKLERQTIFFPLKLTRKL